MLIGMKLTIGDLEVTTFEADASDEIDAWQAILSMVALLSTQFSLAMAEAIVETGLDNGSQTPLPTLRVKLGLRLGRLQTASRNGL